MKIKTIKNFILVLPDKPLTQLQSGLFLPESHLERPQVGIIVGIHPNSELKLGARVIFPKYWDRYIHIGGRDLLHMRESDLLAEIS